MTSTPHPAGPDLHRLVSDLVDLADRLTTLLSRETSLVRAMRIKEIGPLQDDKTRLTAAYQKRFKELTALHSGRSLSPLVKQRLAVSGKRLADSVVENELALRVGMVATDRLIGSIVAAVKEQRRASLTYAPPRTAPRHAFMTAAAVDRRL